MPEPDLLLQRQREILQTFRGATTRRKQAEADAEARHQAVLKTAEDTYAQTRERIDELHHKANAARERLEHGLYSIGLNDPERDTLVSQSQLFHEAQPAPTSAPSGADPMAELENAANRAQTVSWRISDTRREWQTWQHEQAQQRWLWLIGIVLVIVIAALLLWVIL